MTTASEIEKITVLIPAYNEEKHLGKTLAALKENPFVSEIIVVDDGSGDQTAAVAEASGAIVVSLEKNRGKGGAIAAGIAKVQNPVVLLLDADLQESAGKALTLVKPVLKGEADMTIACFPPGQSGKGFGFAKRFAAWGIRRLTGRSLEAPLSGQRCLKKEVLEAISPFAPRFGLEVGMTVDALRLGYRVQEIKTDLFHSPPGRDLAGFLHRARQFADIFSTLCSRSWRCKKN